MFLPERPRSSEPTTREKMQTESIEGGSEEKDGGNEREDGQKDRRETEEQTPSLKGNHVLCFCVQQLLSRATYK